MPNRVYGELRGTSLDGNSSPLLKPVLDRKDFWQYKPNTQFLQIAVRNHTLKLMFDHTELIRVKLYSRDPDFFLTQSKPQSQSEEPKEEKDEAQQESIPQREDDDPDLNLAKKLSLEAHQEKGEEEAQPPPKDDVQSSKKPRESNASASKQHQALTLTGWQITDTRDAGADSSMTDLIRIRTF
ncbi:hypothetical protein Tco_0742539 [Tanacetum coccineum]